MSVNASSCWKPSDWGNPLKCVPFLHSHWSLCSQSVSELFASQHKPANPPTCAELINKRGGILFTIVFCGLFKCLRLRVSHRFQMIPLTCSSLPIPSIRIQTCPQTALCVIFLMNGGLWKQNRHIWSICCPSHCANLRQVVPCSSALSRLC